MGGLVNSIFGGGSKKATKKSLALIKPYADSGVGALGSYMDMLTGPNQNEAFQNWLNSSDYKFTNQAGMEAITHNMASKGLLNSGSTLKALTQFGQNNAQQYRNNYMNQLFAPAQLGAQAAQGYAGTAQQGAQLQANGVGNFLNFGLGVAGLFSDIRLKTDIKKVGRMNKSKGGLPVYTYRYVDDPPNVRRMGVMAQEVAEKRPEALGPTVDNFMTVDYGRLAENA